MSAARASWRQISQAIEDTKYRYNLLRPVTYIRSHIDPSWTPLLITPPFPEYTSGNSVQSAAAAHVFTELFGERYAFVDHTHDHRGLPPRSFGSFFQAAEEAANPRLTLASISGLRSSVAWSRGSASDAL
jgi:hypothetical protein